MNRRFYGLLLLVACLMTPALSRAADNVYAKVMREFAKHPHRMAGSAEYMKCLDTLEAVLKEAGYETHRQPFYTIVPETKRMRFTVGDKEIKAIHPLAPNGAAPVTTGNQVLSGPLLYLGRGSLAEMVGKKVDGAIAVLEWGTPHMAQVFQQGARAVVFVGNEAATQWDVADHFTELPLNLPRFYMDRKTAETEGILTADGSKTASLDAAVVLKDAVAYNLWVEIPGQSGKTYQLQNEEAIVLAATYDTYGAVPELSPDQRGAANTALLAQVLANLSGKKPGRTVYGVFFGSHYYAQEGARNFYYPIRKCEPNTGSDTLAVREGYYREEIKVASEKLELLSLSDFHKLTDEEKYPVLKHSTDVSNWLSRMLKARRSEDNFLLNEIARKVREVSEEEKKEIEARKSLWNKVWEQIDTDTIDDEGEYREAYDRLIQEAIGQLKAQKARSEQMLANNLAYQKIAAHRQYKYTVMEDGKPVMEDGKPVTKTANRVIVGHISFDFANDDGEWLLNMCGSQNCHSNDPSKKVPVGLFSSPLEAMKTIYASIAQPSWKAKFYAPLTASYRPESLCYPRRRSLSCMAAIAIGVYGYNACNLYEPLDDDEMPKVAPVDLRGLSPQLTAFFSAIADDPAMSVNSGLDRSKALDQLCYRRVDSGVGGIQFQNLIKGGTDPEGPAVNAIYWARHNLSGHAKMTGQFSGALTRINADGYVFLPNVFIATGLPGQYPAYAYDENGILVRFTTSTSGNSPRLFYGYGGGLYTPFLPEGYDFAKPFELLDARNNSKFKTLNALYGGDTSVFFSDRLGSYKYNGNGLLLLGALKTKDVGVGLPLQWWDILRVNTIKQGAHDFWTLNESRLDVLRKKNIRNDSVIMLHAEAKEHLDAARLAREEKDIRAAVGHETFALSLSQRAYTPLRDVSNDMVKAVVILLILSIPFAFAMERLVFGFTSIYHQVGGFLGFFIATFAALYFVHPAFSLATAPVVIFLAFIIIVMSGLVIYIIMGKFKREVMALQGLSSKAHSAQSESSTALASVVIGISGMRNRPLKTFLTALTIVLLTFTILVFSSFESKLDVVPSYLGRGQGVSRIEAHRPSFLAIPEVMQESIAEEMGESYQVFRRSAIFMNPMKNKNRPPNCVVRNPKNGKSIKLTAVLGLQAGEFTQTPELRSIFPAFADKKSENIERPISLSKLVADALELSVGDEVFILGRRHIYIGIFDESAFGSATYIDGSRIVAPDYESTLNDKGMADAGASISLSETLASIDVNSFRWSSAGLTGVMRFEDTKEFESVENSIVLYPRNPDANLEKDAEDIARIFQGPVYAQTTEGAKRFFFTTAFEGSGFSEVLVPLILGGLIIFSSLLGSIVDREREIFTFSALGLAPPDVAALFFAESSVYAVIGGLGGYLVSQAAAALLSLLSSYGLFQAPEMNFSSLSSTYTILVVMSTVILSTIYPAIKAGRSANPGIARKWKMPTPEGKTLRFIFPFTVSSVDLKGILNFIKEHFANHRDASLGSFAARDIRVREVQVEGEADNFGLEATVSLAPFDLGVFQKFLLSSQNSDIEGIKEVVIDLECISGSPGTWVRSNRNFLDELRNQFLLWRSLPIETIEHYRGQAVDEL